MASSVPSRSPALPAIIEGGGGLSRFSELLRISEMLALIPEFIVVSGRIEKGSSMMIASSEMPKRKLRRRAGVTDRVVSEARAQGG